MRRSLCVMLLLLDPGCRTGRRIPAPASPEPRSVTSAGVTLSYQVFGDGPPLLVLHGGFGSDSRGFEGLARLLAPQHQVVLFDRRGTGRSPIADPSEDDVTMDLMVADIEAIRAALGVPSWSVLGHSFGGMLASHYTATHPDRVDKLVLSSSSGVDLRLFETDARRPIQDRLDPADRAEILRLEAAHEAGDTSEALLDRFSVVLARAYVYDDAHSGWVESRLRRSDPHIGQLVTQDLRRIGFDSKPALARFERPVLVVQGRQDVLPVSISERAVAAFPDARLVVLDACGHYGWLDQPDAYVSTVLDFLAP